MISLKSPDEIIKMQRAGRVVALMFEALHEMIRPGISTYDLDQKAWSVIKENHALPSFYKYGDPPFPASICTSINCEVVHGIPSRTRILKEGDIISVDAGAVVDGFHGDAARTYAVGKISPEAEQLIRVTEECFWIGFEKAIIGNRLGDISSAIEAHALSYGYGVVRELTGHGIGRHLHEDPDVPNYGKAGHGLRLVDGLVIAVEPMINMGTREIAMLDDEWTFVSRDRKYSSHYENTIAITPNGPVILTKANG